MINGDDQVAAASSSRRGWFPSNFVQVLREVPLRVCLRLSLSLLCQTRENILPPSAAAENPHRPRIFFFVSQDAHHQQATTTIVGARRLSPRAEALMAQIEHHADLLEAAVYSRMKQSYQPTTAQ